MNYRDRFMRALADAENTRKRADRDRREAENYGGSKLARDMLPVYDNLRRALQSAAEAEQEANKALLEGVELTMRELISVFKKHGIDPIVPEVGDKFDPQLHQAMFEAPVARHQGRRNHPGRCRRFHAARPPVAPRAGRRVVNARI